MNANSLQRAIRRCGAVLCALILSAAVLPASAQQNSTDVNAQPPTPTAAAASQQPQQMEAITVTGSRIKKAEVVEQTPVITITAADIQATGLGSIGDVIQQLSVSGSSLNTKFNSAGNFGFAPMARALARARPRFRCVI